jgi:hypothetical protein
MFLPDDSHLVGGTEIAFSARELSVTKSSDRYQMWHSGRRQEVVLWKEVWWEKLGGKTGRALEIVLS